MLHLFIVLQFIVFVFSQCNAYLNCEECSNANCQWCPSQELREAVANHQATSRSLSPSSPSPSLVSTSAVPSSAQPVPSSLSSSSVVTQVPTALPVTVSPTPNPTSAPTSLPTANPVTSAPSPSPTTPNPTPNPVPEPSVRPGVDLNKRQRGGTPAHELSLPCQSNCDASVECSAVEPLDPGALVAVLGGTTALSVYSSSGAAEELDNAGRAPTPSVATSVLPDTIIGVNSIVFLIIIISLFSCLCLTLFLAGLLRKRRQRSREAASEDHVKMRVRSRRTSLSHVNSNGRRDSKSNSRSGSRRHSRRVVDARHESPSIQLDRTYQPCPAPATAQRDFGALFPAVSTYDSNGNSYTAAPSLIGGDSLNSGRSSFHVASSRRSTSAKSSATVSDKKELTGKYDPDAPAVPALQDADGRYGAISLRRTNEPDNEDVESSSVPSSYMAGSEYTSSSRSKKTGGGEIYSPGPDPEKQGRNYSSVSDFAKGKSRYQ